MLVAYNPSDVKPGWVAFFIVLALIAATLVLWRSMNHQLGKIKVPPANTVTFAERFEDRGRSAVEGTERSRGNPRSATTSPSPPPTIPPPPPPTIPPPPNPQGPTSAKPEE